MEHQTELNTAWESLGISNDFMFGKVMQDAELCKELLQRILPNLDIDHIEYPEIQKSIKSNADAKSVRLDVYVRMEKGRFTISKCRWPIRRNCPKEADAIRV